MRGGGGGDSGVGSATARVGPNSGSAGRACTPEHAHQHALSTPTRTMATQQQLVERYWQLLRPGGHLFVGHSESLTGLAHKFRYVQPAVYVK